MSCNLLTDRIGVFRICNKVNLRKITDGGECEGFEAEFQEAASYHLGGDPATHQSSFGWLLVTALYSWGSFDHMFFLVCRACTVFLLLLVTSVAGILLGYFILQDGGASSNIKSLSVTASHLASSKHFYF